MPLVPASKARQSAARTDIEPLTLLTARRPRCVRIIATVADAKEPFAWAISTTDRCDRRDADVNGYLAGHADECQTACENTVLHVHRDDPRPAQARSIVATCYSDGSRKSVMYRLTCLFSSTRRPKLSARASLAKTAHSIPKPRSPTERKWSAARRRQRWLVPSQPAGIRYCRRGEGKDRLRRQRDLRAAAGRG